MTRPGTSPALLPALDGPRARLASAVLLAVAAAWAAWHHLAGPVLPYDDAFIPFRYVDNLFAGRGLVYNPGEAVLGASSPLYLLWLVLLKGVLPGVATPELAVRGNLVPFLGAGAAMLALVRATTGHRVLGAVAAAAFLMNPQMVAVSLGGMEPMLFVALALGALALAARGHGWPSGLLAGLAVLARAEAIALLPVVALALIAARRPRALAASAATCVAVGLAWIVFATLYYGSPIPQSVAAKSAPLYPLPPLGALARFSQWLERWAFGFTLESLGAWRSLALAVAALGASAALLARAALRRHGAWILPAAFWAMLALYTAGNPLPFEWYFPCLVAFLHVLLVVGLAAAPGKWGQAPFPSGRKWCLSPFSSAALLLLTAWLAFATFQPWSVGCDDGEAVQDPIPATQIACDPTRLRVLAYRATAEELGRRLAPGETVAASEVGALGYHLPPAKVLDACGLVSPEAMPYLPVPAAQRVSPLAGAISVDFVRGTDPDWVVTMPFFAKRSLLRSEWFAATYEAAFQVPLARPCWGSTTVDVFRRKP